MKKLCKYRDIFGKTGEGVHKHRLMGLAIVDVVMTIFMGFIISFIFGTNVFNTIIVLFLIGILLHRAFCVRTTIDKILFKKV